ncbi:MAG: hypothetical protein ACP5IM_04060 [Candidatus Bathyarchaeia archaeon]
MRKTILIVIAVMLLLLITGLTTSKLNQPLTNQAKEDKNVNAETPEKTETSTESTQENNEAMENAETSTQPIQAADEQNTPEENNKQTTPTNENIQTLENPNTPPPDGRICYPTSSEQPYAYTPTHTPKETNMSIIPLYPEN